MKKNNVIMDFLFLDQSIECDDFYFDSTQRAVTLKVFLNNDEITDWFGLYKRVQDAFRSGFWKEHSIGDGQEEVQKMLKIEKGVKGWRWETWYPDKIVPLQYR